MLNYLQNGGKIIVIASVVPENHTRGAIDEKGSISIMLNEYLLPGKIPELRILSVQ